MADKSTEINSRSQIQNPYSRENRATYRVGSLERFLHGMGFRTGYDKYMEEMDNQAQAWETQNQSLAYEENYNSAQEQTARMKEAGINPDLDPSTISSGQAAEMAETENRVESPMGQDLEILEKAGEGAAGLAMFLLDMSTGAIAIKSGLQGIKNLKLEGENTEIAGSEQLREAVAKAHEMFDPKDKDSDFYSGRYIGKAMGYSGRRLDQFARLYDDTYNSIPVLLKNRNNLNELQKARWTDDNMGLILEAEELGLKAASKKALVEAERNKQIAEVLKEYPEYTKEMMLSGNIQAMAEASMANTEADAEKAEGRARKARAKVNEINAKADEQLAEEDNAIIQEFYEKRKTTVWDALFPAYGAIRKFSARRAYERASRRKYGRNNDVQDNKLGKKDNKF